MSRVNARTALSRSHEDATRESLRADPVFAAQYLDSVLEDGDQQELMLAMRRLADAFGGVAGLAETADLNVTSLYRTLSPKGNPELRSMNALLKAMGMRLSIRPLAKASVRAKRGSAVKAKRSKRALRAG
jgi:probable addiction module antidote protein